MEYCNFVANVGFPCDTTAIVVFFIIGVLSSKSISKQAGLPQEFTTFIFLSSLGGAVIFFLAGLYEVGKCFWW